MNKSEKKLAEKLIAFFNSPSENESYFTSDENKILTRWIAHGLINRKAFVDVTTMGSDHREFLQVLDYPFTAFGDEEINKNWYLQFRNSKGIIIIRDLFTVIAFLVSLYLAISNVINSG